MDICAGDIISGMDRPRLIRGLRIAWSVWWGILCVLLVAMWVRSYQRIDDVATGVIKLTSLRGRIISMPIMGGWSWSVRPMNAVGGDGIEWSEWDKKYPWWYLSVSEHGIITLMFSNVIALFVCG